MYGKRHIVAERFVLGKPDDRALDVRCTSCAGGFTVTAPASALDRWAAGGIIQNMIPNLLADDAELLISGICPKCWARMFPPEEGEDEGDE